MKLSNKLRLFASLTALLLCLFVGSVAVYAEDMLMMPPEETESLSEEDAKTYLDGKITMAEIKNVMGNNIQAISQVGEFSKEELEYVVNATSAQTDMFANFANVAGDGECGTFRDNDNYVVREVEGEDALEVDTDLHFRNKDIRMTAHISCFENLGPQVTSTEFSLADKGKETFGDKMKEAGSNTLMGMGVVFCVLIFISLIISSFGFIPKLFNKSEKKQEHMHMPKLHHSKGEDIKKTIPVEENNDDTELIAVIAAAIAASENTTTDSFVVRSIRRRF
jgi:sodium pump decarboxylase gamma subunit